MNNESNNNLNTQTSEIQANQNNVVVQPLTNQESNNATNISAVQANVQPVLQQTNEQIINQSASSPENVQTSTQSNTSNFEEGTNPKKSNNKILLIVVAILVIVGIAVAVLFLFNKSSDDNKKESKDSSKDTSKDTVSLDDAKLLEDVTFSGYGCFNSKCSLSIGDGDEITEFEYTAKKSKDDNDLLLSADDYEEYIKVNIYYTEKNNTKTIVDYKIFSKLTNEEIKNLKTEGELRNALGLPSIGNHSESLTLLSIGEAEEWYSFDDEDNPIEYTIIEYKFSNSNNVTYSMKYKNPKEEDKNLVVGNKYLVEFEVVKETNSYEYNVLSISQ